jgi:hypothetical protein
MTVHQVKCWPTMFDALKRGEKPFDVRLNDRCYQKGDYLDLHRLVADRHDAEQDPTARPLRRLITFVLPGGQFGVLPTHCVLGLQETGESMD